MKQVYRVDVGASLSYLPDGKAKPTEHWRGTSTSVIGTANCFSHKGMNQNLVSKLPAGRRNDVKAETAVHMLFGATAEDPYELAKQARDILLHFQSYMHIWLDQNKRNQVGPALVPCKHHSCLFQMGACFHGMLCVKA